MPYKDPIVAKQKAKERYERSKHLWKNEDGSWKKSSYKLENKRASYHKHKDKTLEKRREKRRLEVANRGTVCPVCLKEVQKLVYDHNHTTGEFRDYICTSCNLALGHAYESVEILEGLIEYVKRHNCRG